MFLLAVCCRFFTAFKDSSGSRVVLLSTIASNYARNDLLYDLIAALPWGAVTNVPVFDFVKLLRFKYVWLSLFPPFFPTVFAVIRFLMCAFGVTHVVAAGCCIVICIDSIDSDQFLPEISVISMLQDGGLRYLASLYWSINALVSNTYGHPHTKLQLAYVTLCMLLSCRNSLSVAILFLFPSWE
jgi:hypothetical protein